MSESTCGSCKHFHLLQGQDLRILDQPKGGECREQPPRIIQPIVQNGTHGPQMTGMLVAYLLLNDQFPACGKFEPTEEARDGFRIQLGAK